MVKVAVVSYGMMQQMNGITTEKKPIIFLVGGLCVRRDEKKVLMKFQANLNAYCERSTHTHTHTCM